MEPWTGAVVVLLPTAVDADRLAVDGGDPADRLHVTLAWMGDTEDGPVPAETFDEAVERVTAAVAGNGIVEADVFAWAVFNPASTERDPATVLLVQSDGVAAVRDAVQGAVSDASSFPVWFPHLTLGYTLPPLTDDLVADRMGTVRFDRVRVAYGEQSAEIALEEPMTASARPRVHVRLPAALRGDTLTAAVEPLAAWEGTLIVEGSPTGDGRMFEPNSLRWDDLPIPLGWAREDGQGHEGSVVVGRITEIWRDGQAIRARGDFDLGSDDGREAARLVAGDDSGPIMNGVSVDVDDIDMEVRVAADVLDREQAMFADEVEGDTDRQTDEDGRVVVWEFAADDELLVTTDGRIRSAALVRIPAFVEAKIDAVEGEPSDEPLVASGAPRPPAGYFADPGFGTGPEDDPRLVRDEASGQVGCPLTVTPEGRIFGHLALFQSCHTGFSECVRPPSSASGYSYFRTGVVECSDGSEVPVGRVTMDTLHASRQASAADTLAHYEHTGLAVADVAAGEDQHGIWLAGTVRPGVTDEQLRVLRASPLSGDWRRIGASLELVAALAVNSPGFPVPRAMVASGHVTALQSAGAIRPTAARDELAHDDLEILRRMAARERTAEDARKAAADVARRRVLVASSATRMGR